MRKHCATLALAAVSLLGLAACAPETLHVRVGPPAPIVEARVIPPGRAYVWVPGYYRWDGRTYVWVAGRWELPPARCHAWVPGHWAQHRRGWYWVNDHRRRSPEARCRPGPPSLSSAEHRGQTAKAGTLLRALPERSQTHADQLRARATTSSASSPSSAACHSANPWKLR